MTDAGMILFLQQIVQRASLPGQEQPVIERTADEMRALHFDRVYTDRAGSLIGIIDGGAPGPTLLLDSHCDTVGTPALADWTHDPFSAAIDGGRMYGRGTADMKGALAAMIYAAASVPRDQIAGRIVVSVTVMEEVMEGLSLGLVMDDVQPDFVVIGEATDLRVNHGGRGRAEIQLEAVGKPAHSSNPGVGINAVLRMLPAISAIDTLALPSDPLLGDAIMALTDIISDPYPAYSVIPARCLVTYDRRLLTGESIESVTGAIRALPGLESIGVRVVDGEHITYTGHVLRGPKFFPAWKLDAGHPFVQASLAGVSAAGLPPVLGAYRFCTNAAVSAGVRGVPTIGFGPMTESMAHIVDEYIDLAALEAAARGYAGIIQHVLRPQ